MRACRSRSADYVDFYSSLSPRHEPRPDVPARRRAAAAQLAPPPRRLPRPGGHGGGQRHAESCGPSGLRRRRRRRPRFGPTPRARHRARGRLRRRRRRAHGAAGRRRRTPTSTSSAWCCSTTGSARDIQAFEYQPLGPFLGKSFATTISPWVVPLDALGRTSSRRRPRTRRRVAIPPRDRAVGARPRRSRSSIEPRHGVARTAFADMYWTFAQQLAHITVNGASLRHRRPVRRRARCRARTATAAGQPDRADVARRRAARASRRLDPHIPRRRRQRDDPRGWCGGNGSARIGFGEVQGTIVVAGTEESS